MATSYRLREHWRCLEQILNDEKFVVFKGRSHTVIREGKWCESEQLSDLFKSEHSEKLNMGNFSL